MSRRSPLLSLLALALFGATPARADSLIEYRAEKGSHSQAQPVMIKDGAVLVKAAGGDAKLDFLYQQAKERLVIIDHGKQNFTPITDENVRKIANQVETVEPLIKGFGDQLRKLSPKQRAKWEGLLGGIDPDQWEAAKREAAATHLKPMGAVREVAGVPCQAMRVIKGDAATAEFCLADPAALKLPEADAATVRALLAFTQRVAAQAQGLSQFGFDLPGGDLAKLAGIPVAMRELQGKHPASLTLSKISDLGAASERFEVPEGYRKQALKLW